MKDVYEVLKGVLKGPQIGFLSNLEVKPKISTL